MQRRKTTDIKVGICRVTAAEVDEMWSYVGKKKESRWLWHAIDHHSGAVSAYVFGRRKDAVLQELKKLLQPFEVKHFYPDHWGAYTRQLEGTQHFPGKRRTRTIERKHLTLRTRLKPLVQKTICFSKSVQMHDLMIGMFITPSEFGQSI